ncbi:MAG: site-specific DNA-methyltransferase [Kiritimatiellia bacterium]|nr:site-specific DNA-methyltransferase [Kiritimatiellia bacterium]
MNKIELSEQDMKALEKALNGSQEPPQEVAKKLFPSLFAGYDFKTIKDSRIPTIEYQGKRSEAAILNEATAFGAGSPLQVVRCFDGGKINKTATQLILIKESQASYDANWRNLIVQGDNLQFLKTCFINQDPLIKDKVKGKVKLVYIDPPFATKSDFEGIEGEDSYGDKVDRAEFIESIRERLIFVRELLAQDGSIYVHLDPRMSHPVKIVMDEVFGKEMFTNEIIWKRTFSHGDVGQGAKHLGRLHDAILFYKISEATEVNNIFVPYEKEYIEKHFNKMDENGRRYQSVSLTAPGGAAKGNPYYEFLGVKRFWQYSKENMQKLLKEGRIIQTKEGNVPRKKMYLDESPGVPLQDLWLDIAPIQGGSIQNANYPTQKPELLLDRIKSTRRE